MAQFPIARRLLLQAGGSLLLAPAAFAQQAWPSRPVRVVVAFTAGGTTDILARAVSQRLADKFKQPFVIDNKPGGGGNIGTEIVAKAPPDGYTLIVNSVGPMAVNASLYKSLTFDPMNDLLGGQIQFMFATIPSVIQHIQAGKLRALAVTSEKRSRSMPDVPTVRPTTSAPWLRRMSASPCPRSAMSDAFSLSSSTTPSYS